MFNMMRIYPINYNNTRIFENKNRVSFGSTVNYHKRNICDYTIYEYIFRVSNDEYPQEYTSVNSRGQRVSSPCILLMELISNRKGYGTNAIKNVVRTSLANPKTQGRVMLKAQSIDNMTNPSGFYYKLGFRFVDKRKNEILKKWFDEGGKRATSPKVEGDMYLPKENIRHCLYY